MKKKQLSALVAIALISIGGGHDTVYAAHDENLNEYTLDDVVVSAERTKDQFGDTITEQSYYRTGGDVKVITREEIEKRHYLDLTEAIKRIPGITFQNPGYRGGEYGYEFYNNGISINGDTRVIILIDGRRVDNLTSTRVGDTSTSGTKSTGVNLDQMLGIESVDKIEVIKGPGASVYGPDATGGVINIITRKGGEKQRGTLDLSTGAWHKHNYALTLSGNAFSPHDLRYFFTASRNMSGDTKFVDGESGITGTLGGSEFKEDALNIRLDKKLGDKQNLKLWYNFKQGKDGYPIATPAQKYWNESDWNRIIFNAAVGQLDANNAIKGAIDPNDHIWKPERTLAGATRNPGYRNLFALDGQVYRSFSRFKNNDWELTWTFHKENGMESFVRLYDQNHRYANRDYYRWRLVNKIATDLANEYHAAFPHGATNEQLQEWIRENLAPFPGGDQNRVKEWLAKTGGTAKEPTSWQEERNRGVQVKYAKALGKNDVIASLTYDRAKNFSKSLRNNGTVRQSHTTRSSILGYVQDKIHVSDKFDITPALRYSYYSSYESTTTGDAVQGKGKSHLITPALNIQYTFNYSTSLYFGWTKIYRPLRQGDYTEVNGVFNTPLEDERGNVWTIGVQKEFSERTSAAVHYDWTRMSNAVATLPIWDGTEFSSTAVNAREDKKSFNLTFDHKFNKHVTMSASYSHMLDKWSAKSGWILDPNWGYQGGHDINTQINRLRPANHYALNLSYEKGRLYTGLLANWYTGASRNAFTSSRFLILDWNLNYEVTKDLTAYMVINNLTNQGYETSFNSWTGIGGAAMPGRSWMIGARYNF